MRNSTILLLALLACSKESANVTDALIGTWRLSTFSATECADQANNRNGSCLAAPTCVIIKFEANGSYSDSFGTGTWSPYYGRIWISVTNPNSYPVGPVAFVVSKDALTLTAFLRTTQCTMANTYVKLQQ